MDDKTKLVGLLAITAGAAFAAGEYSMKQRMLKQMRANKKVGNKVLTDLLSRAIEPDCTPQEVERMLNDGTTFLRIAQTW